MATHLTENRAVQEKCQEIERKRIGGDAEADMISCYVNCFHNDICSDTSMTDDEVHILVHQLKNTLDNMGKDKSTFQKATRYDSRTVQAV